MSVIIEIHAIQQFAPSNLNRDDTGSPKDAMFGGSRRARVSSQCFKRSMRNRFSQNALLKPEELAIRTQRLSSELESRLNGKVSDPKTVAEKIVNLIGVKFKKAKADDPVKTEYLLFIGQGEINQLAEIASKNPDLGDKSVEKQVLSVFGASRSVDVALFGRMLADKKNFNVDAATQVAHAISTHRVDKDFDYFTAIDDLAPADEASAGMLSTTEFNSACFYRYALLNTNLFKGNLGNIDGDLFDRGLLAFFDAYVTAVPSGKQNSFAAHNPPSLILVRVSKNGMPINLANAFEKPIYSRDGYLAPSVEALQTHLDIMETAYGKASENFVLDLTGAWKGKTFKSTTELFESVKHSLSAL